MPVKRPNSSEIKSKIVSNIRDTGGESDPQPGQIMYGYWVICVL